jgi:hypothetical protein
VRSGFVWESRIRDSNPTQECGWQLPIFVDVLHVQVHHEIAQLNPAVVDELVFDPSPVTSQTSTSS